MFNALTAAIDAYAELAGMTPRAVAEEIKGGNEVIERSVMMLLFAVA